MTDKWAKFLKARLDEMEARANEVRPVWGVGGDPAVSIFIQQSHYKHETLAVDPAYVLADIAAKRKIITFFESATERAEAHVNRKYYRDRALAYGLVIKAHCEPFAQHPDYPGER